MPRALVGFAGPGDRVVAFDEFVEADDPILVGREDLFSGVAPAAASVEQATAAPGEVREFRRPTAVVDPDESSATAAARQDRPTSDSGEDDGKSSHPSARRGRPPRRG